MRIAIHADGPRIRGNERQLLLLAPGLRERGHTVVVSCRERGPVREAFEAAGVPTTPVRPRGDLDVLSAARFALWLRRSRTDAVLLTSWKRAFVGAWAARGAGVGRVVLRVGGLHGGGRGPGEVARRHALAHACHAIVTNSPEEGGRLLADTPGLPPEAVTVIDNAVAFRPSPPAPLRARLGVGDGLLLVTVGGLEPNKGADLLPPVLSRLGPDVHLAVAGAGTAEQVAGLTAAARALGVDGRFHLLGHRDDVPAVLAAADAFLLPSRTDSLPNAMLEAMAAGVPVVMTAVGGVASALGAGEGRPAAGWVVAVDDVDAIAAGVREVMGDLRAGGEAARARVREARRRVHAWYAPEAMVGAYERVLAAGGARVG